MIDIFLGAGEIVHGYTTSPEPLFLRIYKMGVADG